MKTRIGLVHATMNSVSPMVEAFHALQNGDTDKHNQLIKERAQKLAGNHVDVLVLAQISMARARFAVEELGIPVLTSPQTSTGSIMDQIRKRKR
ncbi:hypothetical protein ACAF76_019785 [Brevibacillus sp. TJ4]|uniref:hypothetical protein n=1 Tax=Brevibacillus sp. TJ4 TaxID=3234853 RepID=UPI0037D12417